MGFYSDEENYDIPVTSNYVTLEDGDNRLRILGSFAEKTAIQGIGYWTTIDGKRKPVRLPKNADGSIPSVPVSELETNKFGDLDLPKYFWAIPVWNYAVKRVQILEINQKTIIKPLKTYIANAKWGDPRDYDIIINRGKEGEKTVYTVTVDPKEDLDQSILDIYMNTPIKIEALFKGEDPFDTSEIDVDEVDKEISKK